MKIERVVVGYIRTNCYIVINEAENKCVVIDPGADGRKIADILAERSLELSAILLTHGHCDHIQGVDELRSATGAKVYIHEADVPLLENVGMNLSHRFPPVTTTKADEYFCDGDVLNFAGIPLKVIHTPGHTKGGVCFYSEAEKVLFAGDTLFHESVGRTDHPGGNIQLEIESIKNKLLVLPEDTVVLPGHGSDTAIGYEKRNNQFLLD